MATNYDPKNASAGHHIPEVIAVRPEDRGIALDSVDGAFELDEERIASLLARMTGDEAGQLQELVGLVGVPDVHEAVNQLADLHPPILASPIHGVGYESHSRYMAGTDPAGVEQLLSPVEEGDPCRIVAVVDSGIVADDLLPEWMQAPSVMRDAIDIETLDESEEVSHGTFVTSLIRQVHPRAAVSIAAAHKDRDGLLVTDEPDHMDSPRPTTELDVFGAILRLINRHAGDSAAVKALNLSLGASRSAEKDGYLLTLSLALDQWRLHFGRNAAIFAAGGNSVDPHAVYPAAFDCVRGVGAAEDGGTETVWDNKTATAPPSRPWVDEVAPGVSLVGLSGRDPEHTVKWSGSSFATAVATASHVRGAPYDVAGGIVWWPNSSVTYSSVTGLHYE